MPKEQISNNGQRDGKAQRNQRRRNKKTQDRHGHLSEKQLSHALSWALRHQALNIGLTITPDGYVPVKEILESTHPRLKGATLVAIQECVASSDKQRFKLEHRPRHMYYGGDKTETILCIRANQGHSMGIIDPDLLLDRLSPESLREIPCIVHGTFFGPWEQISIQGLKKMGRTHIHFAPGLPDQDGVISGMRKSCTVYIFVDAEKCAKDGIDFFLSDNGVLLTAGVRDGGTLPPEYFSHAVDSSGNVLLDNRPDKGTSD